ncbi:MAG: glycosyltransferase [Actinomycetota bacterium]|nr:glycosyltransferase [Actinomycetota bacterium]
MSVVVPTRNSVRTIEECLRSIRDQRYGPIELVVVDNDSTDGTWEVAQRLADAAIRGGPERSAQRNAGVARSSGDFVLWIDSDMVLPPTVVQEAVQAALEQHAEGVFIPEVTVGPGYWTRCRALERRCYLGEAMIESPRMVRRKYLQETGGFVKWLSGTEDAELRMRMLREGRRLARTTTPIVHEEGRLTLGGVVAKRYYYGLGLSKYRQAHPGAMSAQAKATARAFARNRRLLAEHPGLTAGIVAMRAAETVAYLAGQAVGALRGR